MAKLKNFLIAFIPYTSTSFETKLTISQIRIKLFKRVLDESKLKDRRFIHEKVEYEGIFYQNTFEIAKIPEKKWTKLSCIISGKLIETNTNTIVHLKARTSYYTLVILSIYSLAMLNGIVQTILYDESDYSFKDFLILIPFCLPFFFYNIYIKIQGFLAFEYLTKLLKFENKPNDK